MKQLSQRTVSRKELNSSAKKTAEEGYRFCLINSYSPNGEAKYEGTFLLTQDKEIAEMVEKIKTEERLPMILCSTYLFVPSSAFPNKPCQAALKAFMSLQQEDIKDSFTLKDIYSDRLDMPHNVCRIEMKQRTPQLDKISHYTEKKASYLFEKFIPIVGQFNYPM